MLGDVARRGPVLAVLAHPDDESFGLGAVLAALTAAGAEVRVLCLTHGEASTLGTTADLAAVRRRELTAAAERLGVTDVVLHDFPDGRLGEITPTTIDEVVRDSLGNAATLVVFEAGGVTGHRDHQAATAAALRVADRHQLAVLEWGVAPTVADQLNSEFDTAFVALNGDGTMDIAVDRAAQRAAIACHESQAHDNPVLTRRLQLAGPIERIRLR
ncbi:MAG: PIG-L deacetylase family protein, partial [Rhodococcus sp. (in: high G+C Gram-positive bacteria)]|uniref:PIG-L deacetylase family protein n=1 Tax=Rhodococcus sp. TaxID=1831 RepID=UPI003BB09B9D